MAAGFARAACIRADALNSFALQFIDHFPLEDRLFDVFDRFLDCGNVKKIWVTAG